MLLKVLSNEAYFSFQQKEREGTVFFPNDFPLKNSKMVPTITRGKWITGKEDLNTQSIIQYVVFARCVTYSFMSSESFRQQMCSSLSAILLLYALQR